MIRHVAEDEIAEADHTEQLEIEEWRHAGCWRQSVGEDQQVVPEPAERAETREQQPLHGARRPNPVGICERNAENRARQQRIEQRDERRIEGREFARQQHEQRIRQHGQQRHAEGPVNLREARAHDDQDTGEADQNGEHPFPADPLAEKRPGKRRYDERREERDGDGLVEAQISDRDEVAGGARNHQKGSRDLQSEFLGFEQARDGPGSEDRGHEQRLSGKPHPYNLCSCDT